MSPKRRFSSLYFSLSLATVFEISCGSYSSHVRYPGKRYQRRDTKMPVGIAAEGYGAIFSALFSSFPSCEPIKFLLGSSLKECDSQTCWLCLGDALWEEYNRTTKYSSGECRERGRVGTDRTRQFNCETLRSFPSPSPWQPGSAFSMLLRSFSSALHLHLFSVPPDPG